MEGEPARAPGSPAKRCAGNTVVFKSPAFLAWEMKPPGRGHRLESEWGPQGPEIRVLRLPPVESEPARVRAPPRKRMGHREVPGLRLLRHLLAATQPVKGLPDTQLVAGSDSQVANSIILTNGGVPLALGS